MIRLATFGSLVRWLVDEWQSGYTELGSNIEKNYVQTVLL